MGPSLQASVHDGRQFHAWVPCEYHCNQSCALAEVQTSWFLWYGEALYYSSWSLLTSTLLTQTTVLVKNGRFGPVYCRHRTYRPSPYLRKPEFNCQGRVDKTPLTLWMCHCQWCRVTWYHKSRELEILIRRDCFMNNTQAVQSQQDRFD